MILGVVGDKKTQTDGDSKSSHAEGQPDEPGENSENLKTSQQNNSHQEKGNLNDIPEQ